jgi:hypothetical protein
VETKVGGRGEGRVGGVMKGTTVMKGVKAESRSETGASSGRQHAFQWLDHVAVSRTPRGTHLGPLHDDGRQAHLLRPTGLQQGLKLVRPLLRLKLPGLDVAGSTGRIEAEHALET